MTLRCTRCETPLPESVPGFSLVTCRQCGATARIPDREEPHPSVPIPSSRPRGISPTFKVHEDKDVLSVGWDNLGVATSINVTCLEVCGHALSIVTRPLPMPRSQTVDTRQLSSAFCHSYELRMARGTLVEPRHTVSVRTREGRALRLVDNLPHERDAEWLTSFLSERLGLQDEGRP